MDELLEKAYNCYLVYLDRLNYGNTNQNYCLVYDSILAISNNITDKNYVQYFVNNLLCPIRYPLIIPENINAALMWTLNNSETLLNTFTWNTLVGSGKTYPFTTNSLSGFNFLYLSIPQEINFKIYNGLDMIIFDSTKPSNDLNQLFSFIGTMVTSDGINNVYRKDDVYNTFNPVYFKITI